jgi:threonine dehydrogenase-like Zn-dependent dehydrogenase
MSSGAVKVKPLITQKFSLKDMDKGLEIMKDHTEFYSKVMIVMD